MNYLYGLRIQNAYLLTSNCIQYLQHTVSGWLYYFNIGFCIDEENNFHSLINMDFHFYLFFNALYIYHHISF